LVFLLIFYAYCGITMIYLFSSGTASQLAGTPIGGFTYSENEKRLVLYTIFGVLWGNAFIVAAAQFVISSSVCIWYFAHPQSPHNTVRRSFKRLLRYHMGSLAFGTFILAVIQMVRLVLAYVESQMKKAGGSENRCAKCAIKCCECALACFEKCIKFLNKNAYIQIALTGKNFCLAAKDAFFLILHNPVRFGVVSSIGGIFIFFGKIAIASGSTLIGYIIIDNYSGYKNDVYSPLIPSICIFVTSYAIAAVFLSIYGLAADTILACFIVDEQLQKKNNKSAIHCPPSLEKFLDTHRDK